MPEATEAVLVKAEIDWKEFSRKLLFEGVIPAADYAADFTETSVDDIAVTAVDKLGHLFLDK